MAMLSVCGPEKAPRAPLARLDKVGHVNSYSVLIPGMGVRYQTQGNHHILHGIEVVAAV